jgi:ribosomal protein S27AE
MSTPNCSKCGSAKTSATGKSEVPPITYFRCGSCGYVTTVVAR